MGQTRGRELARKSGVGWEGRPLGLQPLKLPSLEEAAGKIRDGFLLWTTQGARRKNWGAARRGLPGRLTWGVTHVMER